MVEHGLEAALADAFAESASDGLVALDLEQRICFANTRLCAMIGVERETLVGAGVLDLAERLFGPLGAARLAGQLRAREDGAEDPYEQDIVRSDGVMIHVRVRPRIVRDAAGRRIGSIAIVTEVTAEVRAREGMAKRHAMLAAVASAARALLDADPWESAIDGILTEIGSASGAERAHLLLSRERPKSEEGEVFRCFEWTVAGVPSARSVLLGATASSTGTREGRRRLLDGEVLRLIRSEAGPALPYLEVTGTLASIVVPVFDGAVPRAMLCLEDCGRERAWDEGEEEALVNLAGILGGRIRRHRVEETLRYHEERHRRILEELPYGVTHIDTAGRHTYVNPALETLLGWPPAGLCGTFAWGALTGKEGDVARAAVLGALEATASVGTLTGRTRRRDGRGIDVQVDWAKDFGPDGRVVGATAVVTDITERLRERAELERSLQDQGVLLREVHHRVKNNLQIVASLLRLTRCGDQATYEHVLQAAERRVGSIALVHDILTRGSDLSRVELRPYLFALLESLRSCLSMPTRSIVIEQRCEELELAIDVAVPVGLALNEAITNALEHAFTGERTGTVRVEGYRAPDGGIAIRVSDDGCGLPPSVDPEDPQSLGLQLVRELTAQVGGVATVRSSDAGTEVLLTIPAWLE